MALADVQDHVQALVAALGRGDLAASKDHGACLRRLAAELPQDVWRDVQTKVTGKYKGLEGRYGRPMAIAIISSAIVGTAVPLPGTSLLAAAPLIALAELHYRLTRTTEPAPAADQVKVPLTESQVQRHGKELVQRLQNLMKKPHRLGPNKKRR